MPEKTLENYHFRKEGDEEELREIYGSLESDVIKKDEKGDTNVKQSLLDMIAGRYHGR